MKRRSFFQSLVKAAAIVALAPQLAFRVRPDLPNPAWSPVDYSGAWMWVAHNGFVTYDGKPSRGMVGYTDQPPIAAENVARYAIIDGIFQQVA